MLNRCDKLFESLLRVTLHGDDRLRDDVSPLSGEAQNS